VARHDHGQYASSGNADGLVQTRKMEGKGGVMSGEGTDV
jgi:hypothetical protein